MKKLFGLVMAGGLILGLGSATQAQMMVQFGRNGTPTVTLGQPAYSQYANPYGQTGYAQPGYAQPGYAQPGYAQPYYPQPGYAQPNGGSYYSSGYAAPARTYNPVYSNPGYGTPVYAPQYRTPTPYYGNGYSPYAQPAYGTGTGVIINGRSYMIPR